MKLKRCPVDHCTALIPLDAVACSKHICQDCGEQPVYSCKAIRCTECHKKARNEQAGPKVYERKTPISHGKIQRYKRKPEPKNAEELDRQQAACISIHPPARQVAGTVSAVAKGAQSEAAEGGR